jgi:hypothetical protein
MSGIEEAHSRVRDVALERLGPRRQEEWVVSAPMPPARAAYGSGNTPGRSDRARRCSYSRRTGRVAPRPRRAGRGRNCPASTRPARPSSLLGTPWVYCRAVVPAKCPANRRGSGSSRRLSPPHRRCRSAARSKERPLFARKGRRGDVANRRRGDIANRKLTLKSSAVSGHATAILDVQQPQTIP